MSEPAIVREVRMEIDHGWGSYAWTGLRDSVSFADEAGHFLVYPIGTQVAFRHVDTSDMNFVCSGNSCTGIHAVSVSKDKAYMAVVESIDKAPGLQLTIYDLREVGVKPSATIPLTGIEVRARSMAWSADNKMVAIAGGKDAEDSSVVVIDWQKKKVACETPIPSIATTISFSPLDNRQFFVTGQNMLRTFKNNDGKVHVFPPVSDMNDGAFIFTDHDWVTPPDGCVVATTAAGPLFIVNCDNLTVDATIIQPFEENGIEAHCVKCFSQGFVVGGNHGYISIFERSELGGDSGLTGGRSYSLTRTIFCGRRSTIYHIDISESEEMMACAFRNADIGLVPVASLFVSKQEVKAEILSSGFHCGPISGLSMALQRPIVASCCRTDCSVRVWNYSTKQCEIARVFVGDEPVALALHPFGYFLAIGFNDKFRMFHILLNELQLFREIGIRGAKVIRFSHGGNYVAVGHAKQILVFCSVTMRKLAILRGHSSMVQGLSFDANDNTLASCGADGHVYEWNCSNWTQIRSATVRQADLDYVSYDGSRRITTAGCDENKGFFIGEVNQVDPLGPESHIANHKMVSLKGTKFNCLAHPVLDHTVMFGGTASGSVWLVPQPIDNAVYQEFGLHMGGVKHICLSIDGRTMITAGEDGCVFVVNVIGLSTRDGADQGITGEPLDNKLSDVVLIKKQELQIEKDKVVDLNMEIELLKSNMDESADRVRDFYTAQISEMTSKQEHTVASLKDRYVKLQTETDQRAKDHSRMVKSMEAAHVSAAEQLEGLYTKKIKMGDLKLQDIEDEKRQIVEKLQQKQAQLEAEFEESEKKMKAKFDQLKKEQEEELQRQKDMVAFSKQRFEGHIAMEQAEREMEIEQLETVHNAHLSEAKREAHQLKREQDVLLRGLDLMERDKDLQAKQQSEANKNIEDLKNRVLELSHSVEVLQKEKRERESMLKEKERKILDYKGKVSTLKKFKHVLDFRLREVSESLQPKDRQISQLKSQLTELESEFELQLGAQREMEKKMEYTNQRMSQERAAAEKSRSERESADLMMRKMKHSLYTMVEQTEPATWNKQVQKMYRIYVTNPESMKQESKNPAMDEMHRNMALMEKKIKSMSIATSREQKESKTNITRAKMENSMLIQDLNELRKSNKDLKEMLSATNQQLYSTQQQCLDLQTAAGKKPKERSPLNTLMNTSSSSPALTKKGGQFSKSAGVMKGTPAARGAMSNEDRQRMQDLLQANDLNNQQIQMQKLEIGILREQLDKLLGERESYLGDPLRQTADINQLKE